MRSSQATVRWRSLKMPQPPPVSARLDREGRCGRGPIAAACAARTARVPLPTARCARTPGPWTRSRPPPHSTAVLSYAHAETESISSSNREQLSRTSGRPCVADRHICTSPADNALSPTRPLACALPDQLGNAIGAFKVQANQSTGTASLDELLRYSDWGEGGIGMDVRMEVGIERKGWRQGCR